MLPKAEGFWPVCFEDTANSVGWAVTGYLNDGYYINKHQGSGLEPLLTDWYSSFYRDQFTPTEFDAYVGPDPDRMQVTYTTTYTYLADGSETTETHEVPEIYVTLSNQSITEQGVIRTGTLTECQYTSNAQCAIKWNETAPTPPYDPDTTR